MGEAIATKARQVAEIIQRRWLVTRARCYKACFQDAKGALTYEGNRALADIRQFAKLEEHSFMRDLQGRIDPIGMARIEGRRELARHIFHHLNLDETKIRSLVEVQHEQG